MSSGIRKVKFHRGGWRRFVDLLLAIVLMLAAIAPREAAAGPCEREIRKAAGRHHVPLGVLYAVGLTETGRGGLLQPNALNIEGTPYFARTPQDAIRRFRKARGQNLRLIDIGCMQINYHYHHHAFRSVAHMLDPAANVDYAARFLKRLRKREGSWTMAVARYHAGPHNDPAQKRYVCRVIGSLVSTGFGAWTPGARKFCASENS